MVLRQVKRIRRRDLVKVCGRIVQVSVLRLCQSRIQKPSIPQACISTVELNLLGVISKHFARAKKKRFVHEVLLGELPKNAIELFDYLIARSFRVLRCSVMNAFFRNWHAPQEVDNFRLVFGRQRFDLLDDFLCAHDQSITLSHR